MSFRVTVEEFVPHVIEGEPGEVVKRFYQEVDTLDLPAVFAAINRAPRVRKARAKKVQA